MAVWKKKPQGETLWHLVWDNPYDVPAAVAMPVFTAVVLFKSLANQIASV